MFIASLHKRIDLCRPSLASPFGLRAWRIVSGVWTVAPRFTLVLAAATLLAVLASSGSASETEAGEKPNVLLILADDMGLSDAGCYGGEIRTPHLDSLAADGLRFTQAYSTGRCWPSRSCILSGYYAQQIRRDSAPGISGGTRGKRPSWAALLPEYLAPLGYHSYHSGKWHVDGQPKAGGFERSWGAHRGGCDWDRFFNTGIWEEDGIRAPGARTDEGYYSTVAIADHAIQCLKLHRKHHGDAPFFQYVAFYSPHFPLHALKDDIAAYEGHYDEGWDVIRRRRWQRMREMGLIDCPLPPRDEKVIPPWNLSPEKLRKDIGPGEEAFAVAWEDLTPEQKEFQAKKMAIHAAMITRMDTEIGRIVDQLKAMGAFDDTLIIFGSDNGASAEQIIRGSGHDKSAPPGSAKSYLCLGPGWSTAANTPHRLHKHWNHEGGIASPLIVHWPAGIEAEGELRHDTCHFIDVAPTVLDLAGGSWPEETPDGTRVPPTPGRSLVPAFAKDGSVEHEALWWCHGGHRAIRVGDWKLVRRKRLSDWELYNLATDRSETRDLAEEHPERVKAMAARWQSILDGFIADLKKDAQR